MNLTFAPEIPEALVERLSDLVATGLPREQAIAHMRLSGLNILASMKLVQSLYGLSRNEAKTVVHFSQAWSDQRETHEELHESAWKALDELATKD